MVEQPRASRLERSTSAYLRSASEQAIDWHPWGEEPFRLARELGRPVLLDIGAAWCHWCHVMDEGTYADPQVSRLLAEGFVAVKVDRDEHPEVDRRFQRQVQALTGEGGWPLTAFLTPEGTVFLGGTYFPPHDGHGRPGFARVLAEVVRIYREEPERVSQNTRALGASLQRLAQRPATGSTDLRTFSSEVLTAVAASFDPVHGGFGGAPKFPHPAAVELLLWAGYHGSAGADDRARETLARMADGGMYDQIGGGFHRYSVDEGWHVPHFEKMGIDNAELLLAYAAGYQRFGEPRFADVVRGTVGWVRDVLGDRAGGFGASQDADNAPGDDGDYFTWTRGELRGALSEEEYRLAVRAFGLDTDGRMPHAPERNVLYRMLPAEEAASGLRLGTGPEAALDRVVATLRRLRAARPAPAVDRALYASVNGRFVAALARAGTALREPTWIDLARRAADRFLEEGFDVRRGVAHLLAPEGARGFGLLDDQSAFALGLVELAAATAEPKYLDAAVALLGLIDREFRGEDGLLRELSPSLYDGPRIAGVDAPSYPLEDAPHASANALAALAFVRLAGLLHDDAWRGKAAALLAPIAARVGGAGLFAASSALAAGLVATEPVTITVEGTGDEAERLRATAARLYHPNAFLFPTPPPPPFGVPTEGSPPGAPTRALVCFGTSCAPPVTRGDELAALVARGRPTA